MAETRPPVVELKYENLVSQLASKDSVPWYRKRNLRRLYLTFIFSVLCVETASGYDSSMLNGLQAVGTWKSFFGFPESTILGLISSMHSLGSILSVPFVPFVVDKTGRRLSVQLGSILMIVGAIIQGSAHNLPMFMVSRVIIGFGITFSIVSAATLIGELSHPKERPFLGSLFNAFFFTGSTLAAGITLGTFRMVTDWAWRIPSYLQLLPPLVQLVFITFIPESPRWLYVKGRQEEALKILVKYHAEGDSHSEFVKAEYAQIEQTLSLEKQVQQETWRVLFSTPGNRRRVLIASFLGLVTQWSGNGLISYFLSPILENVGITDNYTKNLVNLGNALNGLVTAFALAFTVARFPRRLSYLACTTSLLVIFTAWTIASAQYAKTKSQASSKAVIAFIFIYQPFYNLAFNALSYTFLVELFPYHIRAKGMSVFLGWSRAALFFNQFLNPIGIANTGWKFYLSYVCFLAFEVVFVFFLFPETHGRSIEELAFLYEGEEIKREQEKRVRQEVEVLKQEEGAASGSIRKETESAKSAN
ncbi:hexose transporter [Mycena rebaudengoi]|nr:hexose transporter [Mycena rebaudengoi]